jgi:hypothetical protein
MPRRAIVIGSNGPTVGPTTPLKYALNDAQRLAQVLRGPMCRSRSNCFKDPGRRVECATASSVSQTNVGRTMRFS